MSTKRVLIVLLVMSFLWITKGEAQTHSPYHHEYLNNYSLQPPELLVREDRVMQFNRITPEQIKTTQTAHPPFPTLVKDINSSTQSSIPSDFLPAGKNAIFFTATTSDPQSFSWYWSNGKTIAPANFPFPATRQPPYMNIHSVAMPNFSIFYLEEMEGSWELWRSDGAIPSAHTFFSGQGTIGASFVANGIFYFFVSDNRSANATTTLWRSDGIRQGTFPLPIKTSLINTVSSLLTLGKTTYYVVTKLSDQGVYRQEIGRTDGTTQGSSLVTSWGAMYKSAQLIGQLDNRFFYTTTDAEKLTIWAYSGYANQTIYSRPINKLDTHHVALVGDWLLLQTNEENEHRLWNIDPKLGKATFLKGFKTTSEQLLDYYIFNKKVYFLANAQKELWVSDGTVDGTLSLLGDDSSYTLKFGPLNRPNQPLFYFFAQQQERWLMQIDSNTQAITRVKNLGTTLYSQDITHISHQGNKMIIVVDDSSDTSTLWVSDGTPNGTQKLYSGTSIYSRSEETGWRESPDQILFITYDYNKRQYDLWRTNYTPKGSWMIQANIKNLFTSTENNIIIAKDNIYYTVYDDRFGIELWVSNGSPGNKQIVSDLNQRSQGSYPTWFNVVGNRICFATRIVATTDYYYDTPNFSSPSLWCSDGTESGTYPIVESLIPSTEYYYRWNNPIKSFQGQLYFFHDEAVWRTNGTASGTVQLKFPHASILVSSEQVAINGILYSLETVEAPEPGVHYDSKAVPPIKSDLWRTDGTAEGSWIVKKLGITEYYNAPRYLSQANGFAFFYYEGLWRSNGSLNGTIKLPIDGSKPTWGEIEVVPAKNQLFFTAYSNTTPFLWRSDGSVQGTYKLPTAMWPNGLFTVGNSLYFHAFDSTYGHELWYSDGSTNGTYLVTEKIALGWQSSFPYAFGDFSGNLLFTAQDNKGNRALWISDGSEVGTRKLKALPISGTQDYKNNRDAIAIGMIGRTYFFLLSIQSPDNKLPLWQTDGSEAGTKPVVFADGSPIYTEEAAIAGKTLYFTSEDDKTGVELWKLTP